MFLEYKLEKLLNLIIKLVKEKEYIFDNSDIKISKSEETSTIYYNVKFSIGKFDFICDFGGCLEEMVIYVENIEILKQVDIVITIHHLVYLENI